MRIAALLASRAFLLCDRAENCANILNCTKPGLHVRAETCLGCYRLRRLGDGMTTGAHMGAKGSWDNPAGGKTMGLGPQLAQGAGAVQ